MKVSIITSFTDPDSRMDPWKEALLCYENFADEIIVTGQDLKHEFEFSDIARMFQQGFDLATGEWVVKMDIDTFLHEKDFKKIHQLMKIYKDYPAISLRKFQFYSPERYHMKSRMPMILNKKKFKKIKFNGGGDGCDPTFGGVHFNEKNVPISNISFWNYDFIFKTKKIISEDRARFARAWEKTYGNYGERGGPSPEEAFDAWFQMVINRYKKHIFKMKISEHPIFIQKKLIDLTSEQFGYDLFGLKLDIIRSPIDYVEALKEMYLSEIKLKFNRNYKKAFKNEE